MQHYSVLDLSPISEGATATDALSNTLDLAPKVESLGYHRYWLAEHHNMAGIASAATSVVIGQVAARTKTMRVGAGGIMLPNHSPLVIAEQFGTLATLFPGRIDLGVGRAPGTDMNTARALRRHLQSGDEFPRDVLELLSYFDDVPDEATVRAIPGAGTQVPVWILGSSLFGAQLAAHLGLPYAFASHFAPQLLEQALKIYRETFQPSKWQDKPYVIVAASVCAADTDEEAAFLRSSQVLSFTRMFTGRRGKLPRPTHDLEVEVPEHIKVQVDQSLSCSASGSSDKIHSELTTIISDHQPNELIITGSIHDHVARCRSFEIAAEVLKDLT
ncbi:MAG: LLM class flavin-dependent oxidoreductase [Rhizobiaceae bacterium]